MQEEILVRFDRTVAPADVQGFKDVLTDVILEQGSSAVVAVEQVPVNELNGQPVSITWMASYAFATPDDQHRFGEDALTVTVTGPEMDHELLMSLLAKRSHTLNKAYRNALRGIYNLSVNIRDGAVVPVVPVAEYLSETIENAIDVFPNTN